jgi:hypothetical protein
MRRFSLAVVVLGTSMVAAAGPGEEPVAATPEKGAKVHCTIRAPDERAATRVVLDGPCSFRAEDRDGSFSLAALDGKSPLYPGTLVVSVAVVAPGEAEVRGLTADGINSRWGEARRSKADPACWTGSDFEVCARKKK